MPDKKFKLLKELKRRNIPRVATVYAIAGWLIIQIADVVFPYLGISEWVVTALIVIVLIGFPVAVVLAWFFEMSPQGIIRTSSKEADTNPLSDRKRKPLTGAITISILVLLLIGQFVYFSFIRKEESRKTQNSESIQVFPSNSIAVLPFVNMSEEKDNQYFSDGVMEAVLNNLSMIRDLKVVSRTSVEKYRDQEVSIREIASELEVANILEGSVQRVGDQVRVTVQLISAENDEHLWANSYDRQLTDIFGIQSEIAEQIADNLEVILTTEELELIKNSPTSNLRAYELFLKATHMNRDTEDRLLEQISICNKAIELDPDFSSAYAWKGDLLSDLALYGYPKTVFHDSAMRMSDVALEKNDNDWWAHLLKAKLNYWEYNFSAVRTHLNKVVQLNPNSDLGNRFLGELYMAIHDYGIGIDYLLKASSLTVGESDPDLLDEQMGFFLYDLDIAQSYELFKKAFEQNGEKSNVAEQLANCARYFEEFDKMVEYALINYELKPDLVNAGNLVAESYLFKRDFSLAEEQYGTMIKASSEFDSYYLVYPFKHRYGYAKMMNGEIEEGTKLLEIYRDTLLATVERNEIRSISFGEYYDLACIYSVLGDKETALIWLLKARERETKGAFFSLAYLRTDPMLDKLRDDPVFQGILEEKHREMDDIRKLFYSKLKEYHQRNELKWLKINKV